MIPPLYYPWTKAEQLRHRSIAIAAVIAYDLDHQREALVDDLPPDSHDYNRVIITAVRGEP